MRPCDDSRRPGTTGSACAATCRPRSRVRLSRRRASGAFASRWWRAQRPSPRWPVGAPTSSKASAASTRDRKARRWTPRTRGARRVRRTSPPSRHGWRRAASRWRRCCAPPCATCAVGRTTPCRSTRSAAWRCCRSDCRTACARVHRRAAWQTRPRRARWPRCERSRRSSKRGPPRVESWGSPAASHRNPGPCRASPFTRNWRCSRPPTFQLQRC